MRSDLRAFVRSAASTNGDWRTDATPATSFLASLSKPPRVMRPATHRRKAAAVRAFYRFCFAEGVIERDIAGLLDLPRAARVLPDTLGVADVEALLEAPDRESADGIRDRALLELLYACGLRVSEALNLDREDLSLEEATVRVIGKGDRERRLPVGDVAVNALRRYLSRCSPAASRACARQHDHKARRARIRGQSRRAVESDGGVAHDPQGRVDRWCAWPRDAAYAAPQLRDAPARGWGRPARRAGIARTREHHHHAAIYAT